MATISPEDVRKAGAKSKSGLLATALKNGKLIIVVTMQTFPFALDEIRADNGAEGQDGSPSSPTRRTRRSPGRSPPS